MMKLNFNSLKLGLILGLIAPLITIFVFYLATFKTLTFGEFFSHIIRMDIHIKLLSLCVVPNLLLFFIFIWREMLKSARGVLLATFIYAFVVFILKFLI